MFLVLLAGCSYSRSAHPDSCRKTSDCGKDQSCFQGFCVEAKLSVAADAGSSRDGGGSGPSGGGGSHNGDAGTADAGDAGMPCTTGLPPESCYDGDPKTKDVGICKAGQRACVGGMLTPCLGQVLPGAETCNGKDDNCDGTVDEIPDGDCQTAMSGVCAAGLLVCRGAYAVCEPKSAPVEETCNGLDDDCDGKTDEVSASAPCYPANTVGCTIAADGSASCVGLCRAGQTQCTAGHEGCGGAITPVAEMCTSGSSGSGATPADENCDGNVDEGCSCSSGQSRSCYAGPADTEGKGACHAGTQQCMGGIWGDCSGQQLPQPETCDNMGTDDDCNGHPDDIPGLGDPCIDDSKLGICRDGSLMCAAGSSAPTCVTMMKQQELCDSIDQDCDGNPYDGFDLTSDPNNCGKCGVTCKSTETCCESQCMPIADFGSDPKHCGSCSNVCGNGTVCCGGRCTSAVLNGGGILPICGCSVDCGSLTCCGSSCVDLMNDAMNCGSCGHDCTNGGTAKGQCCGGKCSLLCLPAPGTP